MYQGYFGNAFSQGKRCQDEFNKFRKVCVEKKLDAVAEEVLAFTNSMKGVAAKDVLDITEEDIRGCTPAYQKYQAVAKYASQELEECLHSYFYVDVATSKSCS